MTEPIIQPVLNTKSAERFRLSVTASDPELLSEYKELLKLQLEEEKKGVEYRIKDMDIAEAERLRKMQEGDEKKRRFTGDSTL